MNHSGLDEILSRLRQAEADLEQELDRLLEQQRRHFKYRLSRGKVVFEQNFKRLQRQYRTSELHFIFNAPLAFLVSAPLIYSMILPLRFLDACITLYQSVCFPIYRIPRVRRRDYLVIDRHHLAYLNAIEKFNCVYCGYSNGLIEYAREVTARTEQYWCPIKHARRTLDEHARTRRFFDFGDAETYRRDVRQLRSNWSK